MRQFGTSTPDTPEARKKNRIGAGILFVAILLCLIANLVGAYGGPRAIIGPFLFTGGALLLVAIVYMLVNRRAS
jgi:hypothetical protein